MATAPEDAPSGVATYHAPPFTADPSLAPFLRPVAACLGSFPALEGLATGNLVIVGGGPTPSPGPGPGAEAVVEEEAPPRLLLVQRAPHDSMPLHWEVPGGAVDADDESVVHGAARELFEEAHLVATHFAAAVVGGDAPEEFFTRAGRRMGKISFLVDVSGAREPGGVQVTLDPNEHVAFLWVTEEEARARRAGDVDIAYTRQAQEDAVIRAFQVWRDLRSRSEPTI